MWYYRIAIPREADLYRFREILGLGYVKDGTLNIISETNILARILEIKDNKELNFNKVLISSYFK